MQRLNCTFARDRDDKSYYDSLTDGWGDNGKVLARSSMHIAQHSDKQLLVHSCISYTIEHCISAKLANKLEKIPRMKEKK